MIIDQKRFLHQFQMSVALFCSRLRQVALREVSPSPRCPGIVDRLSLPMTDLGDLGCPINHDRKAQRSTSQQPVEIRSVTGFI